MEHLHELRQGDSSYDEQWFVYRSTPDKQCNTWIDTLEKNSVYTSFDVMVTSYSALSAWEYLNSIPLDLDYLS